MEFFYTDHAVRQLHSLDRSVQIRIAKKMRFFAEQEDPRTYAKPLAGYHNVYRFRIGDIRVVCEQCDTTLFVLFIARRDSIYNDM
jgi:mRNA-degrading endonuclease RelE of RelBE toxin-antitoxin system